MAVDARVAAAKGAAPSASATRSRSPKAAGGNGKTPTKPTNPRPGRVSPNEVVAGLAGSAICMLVSTAARLAKRRFRRKLSERESARLEAMKQELRDAMDQLREQRRTLDHLAAQNKEMAIENQQLKRQAAEVAEVVSRGVSTPKGVLSLRTSPESTEGEPGFGEGARPFYAARDASADPVRALVRDAFDAVLRSAGEAPMRDYAGADDDRPSRGVAPPQELSFIHEEEDAWAGVPRGSPRADDNDDDDDFDDARSVRSAASGFSGISDLSTLSQAEAALTRMRTKFVLMARIKSHR